MFNGGARKTKISISIIINFTSILELSITSIQNVSD